MTATRPHGVPVRPGRARAQVLADRPGRTQTDTWSFGSAFTALREVLLVLGGTLFITVLAQVAVPLPFTPVPVTLGTLGVLLAGASLGPMRGLLSAGIYLIAGVLGAPVFAGGASGWQFASFGYVVGFVLAAAMVGELARRRHDRHVARTLLLAGIGSLMVYACGVPWLMHSLGVSFNQALNLGVYPFLAGDALKIAIVAVALPSAWKVRDGFTADSTAPLE